MVKNQDKEKAYIMAQAHQQLQVSGKNTSDTHNITDDKDNYTYG